MTWQPIETAPKDTDVLVFAEDTIGIAKFYVYVYYKPKGMWAWDVEPDHEIHPTHWMPLPAPPEVAR
jgi:hypothetical protein